MTTTSKTTIAGVTPGATTGDGREEMPFPHRMPADMKHPRPFGLGTAALVAAIAAAAACGSPSSTGGGGDSADGSAGGSSSGSEGGPDAQPSGNHGDGAPGTDAAGDVATKGPDGGSSGSHDAGADALPPPFDASSVSTPTMAIGNDFGCLIDAQGNLACWGANNVGNLGYPAGSPDSGDGMWPRRTVPGLGTAVAVAAGNAHACAVTASQTVLCWGDNALWQLGHSPQGGNGTPADPTCDVGGGTMHPCSSTPTAVAVPPAVSVAAHGDRTCAVTTTGDVWCWGSLAGTQPITVPLSQCAATLTLCWSAPYQVAGVTGVVQLSVGNDHDCALLVGDRVACWGANDVRAVSSQACSDGAQCPDCDCDSPVMRPDLSGTADVAAGGGFTCARATDGTVRCFGDNSYGQLGHVPGSHGDVLVTMGTSPYTYVNPTPVAVDGLPPGDTLVLTGSGMTGCALHAGAVYCWGWATSAVATVSGLPAMKTIAPSDDPAYMCGTATDESIWCWDVQQGDTTPPSRVP